MSQERWRAWCGTCTLSRLGDSSGPSCLGTGRGRVPQGAGAGSFCFRARARTRSWWPAKETRSHSKGSRARGAGPTKFRLWRADGNCCGANSPEPWTLEPQPRLPFWLFRSSSTAPCRPFHRLPRRRSTVWHTRACRTAFWTLRRGAHAVSAVMATGALLRVRSWVLHHHSPESHSGVVGGRSWQRNL